MLITTTYQDVPTKLDPNGRPIRIFVISPNLPNYPHAKFPGRFDLISTRDVRQKLTPEYRGCRIQAWRTLTV